MKRLIILLLAFVFALTACTQPALDKEPELMDCTPYEGADVCTMQYDPVCAKLATGGWKTFSNACTACISGEVAGYKGGEC